MNIDRAESAVKEFFIIYDCYEGIWCWNIHTILNSFFSRYMHVLWFFSSAMPLKDNWFQLEHLKSCLMVLCEVFCIFNEMCKEGNNFVLGKAHSS